MVFKVPSITRYKPRRIIARRIKTNGALEPVAGRTSKKEGVTIISSLSPSIPHYSRESATTPFTVSLAPMSREETSMEALRTVLD